MLFIKVQRPAFRAVLLLLLAAGARLEAQTPALPTVPSAATSAPAPKPKLSPLAEAPNWKQLETLSGAITREEFESAINTIYSDGSSQKFPWTFSSGKVSIDTTPGRPPVEIVFRNPMAAEGNAPRYWRAVRELPPLKRGEPPLRGLHVALDAGHIGGSYAKMEERWLSLAPNTEITEGQLTVAVAQIVHARLEPLGARVSIVHPAVGEPVTTMRPDDLKPAAREILKEAGVVNAPESYAGIEGDAKVATVQWQAEKLFYRISEIQARAKKVNTDLKPDLVVCLHFNAEAWGDPAHPTAVPQNHFHLLVNGCYLPEELELEDVRFNLIQRLFTRVHEEERKMAEVMAGAMAASTGLAAYVYPGKNARRISASPYVFARNLQANRSYQCPVIYLEPYVMNNAQVYQRLLRGHWVGRTLIDGVLQTSALEDYARGVVNGVVEYCKQERPAAP